MKKILLFSVFLLSVSIYAQEATPFTKKGKFLIETGYNIIGGLTSGTGISILSGLGGDGSITSLGFDGGTFLSENFALKLKFSLLSA